MACFFTENIHTKSFTPREYQLELLDAAKDKNIIVCLNHGANKTFIALKLLQELSNSVRLSWKRGGKRSLYIGNHSSVHYYWQIVKHLTDLTVGEYYDAADKVNFENNSFAKVIAATYNVCAQWIEQHLLDWCRINLVIIEDCHNSIKNHPLRKIIISLKEYKLEKPRILGLTTPLFLNSDVEPGCVEAEVKQLEVDLLSQVETASDIVSTLRYNAHPKEVIVECGCPEQCSLSETIEMEIICISNFLNDHRYDPSEIYDDTFTDELKDVPDPKKDPFSVITDFLDVLHTMGPWCADKAALVLLVQIEKLKVKTPYERHFLLLCLISTTLLKIRAICDNAFQGLSETEKILKYSTPKVLRLIEIVRQFKPRKSLNTNNKTIIIDDGDIVTQNESHQRIPYITDTPKNNKERRGWKYRRGTGSTSSRTLKHQTGEDADHLCGIIFVQHRFTAKILYHLFHDLYKNDPDFANITTQYTVGKMANPHLDPREAEIEHRKQEDVLKRFRMRECNLVVATSVLEDGIELPRCNLIVRYDPVIDYKSFAHSKGRARQQISYYISLVESINLDDFIDVYGRYMSTEKILLDRSTNDEPTSEEEKSADNYDLYVPEYKPLPGETDPKVSMGTAIALVNRYCAKLPSDTFTRLTPLWTTKEILYLGEQMYFTLVRLPINSPIKEDIIGHPMPTKVLARRIAALETCRVLHVRGELDDNLEPIGKEAFNTGFEEDDLTPISWDPSLPRPGTTKSRQYYYKRIANCLNDCRPTANVACKLYNIDMELTCPLPEEQNTRGRKLHPPELAPQAFGILTLKQIPKICPFPIFTRSGEVRVSLRLCSTDVILTERHVQTISAFLNFIFTSVLRLQKYLMSFDPEAEENSFFIVPTRKNENAENVVDWDFLELIYSRRNDIPHNVSEKERKNFVFDAARYHDAVVMPWYRNQDQPQYFYVAEICNHLNPKSAFPGTDYSTFEDYYMKKYGIQIQNFTQPLLDVDHTSARLNFLTPRYVNRKGVALPTSSEETKKAKRENLEQKQILVAELCLVHIVPASLWRQAVCLPCILYRVNALLLADEIRITVANEVALGLTTLPEDFEWPPLDFGWSLADVLKKSKEDHHKKEAAALDTDETNSVSLVKNKDSDSPEESVQKGNRDGDDDDHDGEEEVEDEENDSKNKEDWMEIGTWSNEMAQLESELSKDFPPNLTMVNGNLTYDYYYSDVESDSSSEVYDVSSDQSDNSSSHDGGTSGLKITFKNDYLAEAIEDDLVQNSFFPKDEYIGEDWSWECDEVIDELKQEIPLKTSGRTSCHYRFWSLNMLIKNEDPFIVTRKDNVEQEDSKSIIKSKKLNLTIENYKMDKKLLEENSHHLDSLTNSLIVPYADDEDYDSDDEQFSFSFDSQPDLEGHPGPSPSLLLQALTMSNANDGINLERLETIGDSFLKYAITTYLYCTHENIHEGKLSHLRSKQVSNLKLYRLGQKKVFGESMIASKFEPHDNWLPPCYLVPRDAEQELLNTEPLATLPYNLVTQHSIPDKSIADCVEALIGKPPLNVIISLEYLIIFFIELLNFTQIGAYLIECGPRGALIFMSWLGIKVLPKTEVQLSEEDLLFRPVGSTIPNDFVQVRIKYQKRFTLRIRYGELAPPKSPLLRHLPDPESELMRLMAGFDSLERKLKYNFKDKSYLLQAMTHASYSPNRLTDCYQRLEFLGDAVLGLFLFYMYIDKRAHSPGALTDLRSALVNNTIFASLAVKHGFHKYFRHLSPGLGEVVQRFVTIQEENSHAISEEFYLVGEEAEDVEVPKALGDVFESVAGAIFLDSSMSLDIVWRIYYRMMKKEIEQFSTKVPKSPIRELLELEPETAKFSKPEKLADGRRVRVTVEVFGKGTFKGIGRNYRIAKCTAAKCALKQLKKKGL
uniref:ribonuclease III n=1 Tax=Rhodnius prolixus TaxID=13249 RepID=T1HEL3_RHOPR